MQTPHGITEIRRTFGDPRQYIREDGTISPAWEELILGSVSLPGPVPLSWDKSVRVSRFRCHKLLVPVFSLVFEEIYRDGLWPLIREFGGCYNWRTQRGSVRKLSTHAWGIAIDLNPSTNQMGTEGDQSAGVLEAFGRHGFIWGGDFTRPDPQHWQFAEGW